MQWKYNCYALTPHSNKLIKEKLLLVLWWSHYVYYIIHFVWLCRHYSVLSALFFQPVILFWSWCYSWWECGDLLGFLTLLYIHAVCCCLKYRRKNTTTKGQWTCVIHWLLLELCMVSQTYIWMTSYGKQRVCKNLWKPVTVRGHVQLNTLRQRKNGRHFADDIFKCIFLNENVWIPIKISLKFLHKGPINYIPSFVQIMVRRRPGAKPLSEPMMVSLLMHICVTRPQWVNSHCHACWQPCAIRG